MKVPLLQPMPIRPPGQSPNVTPLYLEFQVDPATSPYLVSSSKDFVWVTDEAMDDQGRIRAAVREMGVKPGEFNLGIVEAIEELSNEAQWGNVLPLTKAGVVQAIEYVSSYELGELEVLVSDKDSRLFQDLKVPVVKCPWIPDTMALVVPRDRSFLGVLGRVGRKLVVVLVHNAARGIAICRKSAK